jgi:hypothetical protein
MVDGLSPAFFLQTLRNPSSFNQDLSVRRDFPISRMRLGIGFDVFNLFNNVVFAGIQTNITNANFGAGRIHGAHRPRPPTICLKQTARCSTTRA